MNVIETDRLVLRRLTPEDVDDLAAIYADPEVMRFFDGPRTRAQTQENVAWCLTEYEQGNPSLWATILKADGRFIGRCGLLPQEIEGRPEAEVAYMIARPYWNQGLGTEAARAIKAYAFQNFQFDHVISIIAPDNIASQRVAEKNGMHHERDAEYEGHLCRIYSVNRPGVAGTPDDDFSDLGFDMERHREALTSFARLNLAPVSIRPALRARDLVFVRLPSSRFALGVTDDPHSQEKAEVRYGGIGFKVIHMAANVAEAELIRGEVERYFLRHYPGRTLPRPDVGQAALSGPIHVYVTCHTPLD